MDVSSWGPLCKFVFDECKRIAESHLECEEWYYWREELDKSIGLHQTHMYFGHLAAKEQAIKHPFARYDPKFDWQRFAFWTTQAIEKIAKVCDDMEVTVNCRHLLKNIDSPIYARTELFVWINYTVNRMNIVEDRCIIVRPTNEPWQFSPIRKTA